jgi:hypothetical protein
MIKYDKEFPKRVYKNRWYPKPLNGLQSIKKLRQFSKSDKSFSGNKINNRNLSYYRKIRKFINTPSIYNLRKIHQY